MKKRLFLAAALIAAMSFACLTGCGNEQPQENAENMTVTELASGGVMLLSVNPEIGIHYDADGNVTKLEARNEDAKAILEKCVGYEGKTTREVVTELVNLIGEAGYFVEEIEGESRKITIEIETGSILPNETFLDDVIADVQQCVTSHDWNSSVAAGETIYGITDYVVQNQTTVPEQKPVTEPTTLEQNQAPAVKPNAGVTDYGRTDYDDTDYGPNNDGVTDYHHADDHQSDYHHTDYHDTDYDGTDYHH